MPKQIVNISDTVKTFQEKVNIISRDVGWRGNLTTTVDSDLVGAINELETEINTLQGQVIQLDSDTGALQLGDLSLLHTTAKDTLVNAINELDNRIDSDADFRNKVSATDAGGDGSFAYNQSTGVFTYTGPSAAETQAHFSAGTNTTYSAGSFSVSTDTIRGKISVSDTGGDGSLAYSSSTGVLTYTGPSAADTRAHFSGGNEITITSGSIAHDDITRTDTTSTTSATYGGTFDFVSSITSNARGHITAVDTETVTLPAIYSHPNHSGDVTSSGDGATTIANNAVTQDKMADDAVGSAELKSVVSLVIYNSSGTAVKTLYGAGS
jgi:hypothetical protein